MRMSTLISRIHSRRGEAKMIILTSLTWEVSDLMARLSSSGWTVGVPGLEAGVARRRGIVIGNTWALVLPSTLALMVSVTLSDTFLVVGVTVSITVLSMRLPTWRSRAFPRQAHQGSHSLA
jgi:hypothetical protein